MFLEVKATKASALNGAESVRKNAQDAAKFETKEAKNGKFHFDVKATNGQVMGTSKLYTSESGIKNGIKSVAKSSLEAKIVDLTA